MVDEVKVEAKDVIPGNVLYSNRAEKAGIAVKVQLSRTATVRVESETGTAGAGDCDASHTLLINGEEKDKRVAEPRFNDWNGTVGTVMVFEAMKWYAIEGRPWNNNANTIATDVHVTVVLT